MHVTYYVFMHSILYCLTIIHRYILLLIFIANFVYKFICIIFVLLVIIIHCLIDKLYYFEKILRSSHGYTYARSSIFMEYISRVSFFFYFLTQQKLYEILIITQSFIFINYNNTHIYRILVQSSNHVVLKGAILVSINYLKILFMIITVKLMYNDSIHNDKPVYADISLQS